MEYEYDDANRIMRIDHLDPLGVFVLTLDYSYVAGRGDAPSSIHERVAGGVGSATATFAYDNRGRLIAETRQLENPTQLQIDLEYKYDQGGNRTKKIDLLNDTETRYEYDIDDVGTYGTANNRLMLYRVYDSPGPGETLVSTTYYYYNGHGNPTRVVTELENPGPEKRFTSTLMHYAGNGDAVTHVMGEAWNNNGSGIENYVRPYAREFRYDGGRARYMDAELQPFNLNYIPGGTTWTDYDGDRSYGDFIFVSGQPTSLRSFEPGLGRISAPGTANEGVAYYHGDQIGTTRHMSDEAGAVIEPAVYTAFGQQVTGTMQDPSQRYPKLSS